MELYNSLIRSTEELLGERTVRKWAYDPAGAWPDMGKNQLIMQREAAYELGGSGRSAVTYSCVTTDEKLVPADEVWLCGPDLAELSADSVYGRIVLFAVQDIGEEDEAYRAIQNIDLSRYHVYPDGYMTRALSEDCREQVRVSRAAIKKGISFAKVGFDYIRRFKEDPNVRFVRVVFITDPAVCPRIAAESGVPRTPDQTSSIRISPP